MTAASLKGRITDPALLGRRHEPEDLGRARLGTGAPRGRAVVVIGSIIDRAIAGVSLTSLLVSLAALLLGRAALSAVPPPTATTTATRDVPRRWRPNTRLDQMGYKHSS